MGHTHSKCINNYTTELRLRQAIVIHICMLASAFPSRSSGRVSLTNETRGSTGIAPLTLPCNSYTWNAGCGTCGASEAVALEFKLYPGNMGGGIMGAGV